MEKVLIVFNLKRFGGMVQRIIETAPEGDAKHAEHIGTLAQCVTWLIGVVPAEDKWRIAYNLLHMHHLGGELYTHAPNSDPEHVDLIDTANNFLWNLAEAVEKDVPGGVVYI